MNTILKFMRVFRPYILLVLVAWLEGCTLIRLPSTSTLPLSTISATDNNLSSQSKTSSPTASSTKTPTTTIAITPTHTQIFTPAGQDAKSKVEYLLETNGNCSLPCWWGITPGQTTWNEAEAYLTPFAIRIPSPVPGQQDDLTYYPLQFPNPISNTQADYLFAEIAVNQSSKIEYISSSLDASLASILKNIGVPSQIWLEIITNFGPGPQSFTLALFYDKGIMIVYYGTTNNGDMNFINICPSEMSEAQPQLWVWNIDTLYTFEDIGKFSLIAPLSPNRFRLLTEVSDMQPQTFYNYYVNPSTIQCIRTPWSDWPG